MEFDHRKEYECWHSLMIKTHAEFLQIALKSYDNPILSSIADFNDDVKRFSYLNTMITRFIEDGNFSRIRMAVNHIVILCNCFGVENTINMIRFKVSTENASIAETLMYYLKMISKTTDQIDFKLLTELENL